MNLQEAFQSAQLWRGREFSDFHSQPSDQGIETGYSSLDNNLPFGGWPKSALVEILYDQPAQGEMQLVLPALAKLSQEDIYIAMINPPWQPYAPAMTQQGIKLESLILSTNLTPQDQLWALEQSLKSGHFGAVLCWLQDDLDTKTLRRLQLAASTSEGIGFLFRHSRFKKQHSPASLRIQLHTTEAGCRLEIIKCRGKHFRHPFFELHLSPFTQR